MMIQIVNWFQIFVFANGAMFGAFLSGALIVCVNVVVASYAAVVDGVDTEE